MSLGLPVHLSREASGRALAAAANTAGLVCLVAAGASTVLPALAGSHMPWLGVLVLLPMAVLLVLLDRRRTTVLALAYLVVGGTATAVYVAGALAQSPSYVNTNLFVTALPVAALIFVGGSGAGSLRAVLWTTAGFAVGELAVGLGALATHRLFQVDGTTLGVYLLMVAVHAFDGLTRNARRGAQASIARAQRQEAAARARRDADAAVVGELHDTVLSQLSMIAAGEPGTLSPELRRGIEDALAVSWAAPATQPAARADAGWHESALAAAIEQARDNGLAVTVSGNRAALDRVSPDRGSALGLAARQCLANVLVHSGVLDAEVTVSDDPETVTVMIVDGGAGFDQASVDDARIGLRHAVRDRLSRVGGQVDVYSRPGAGTAVVLSVPAGEMPAVRSGTGDAA